MTSEPFDEIVVSGPGPEGAVCDFCSSPDVHWTFPCRDHARHPEGVVALVENERTGQRRIEAMTFDSFSQGGWAACNPCHRLILSGSRDRLARRSARRMIRKHPDSGFVMSNLTAHIRRLQDQFWTNREGPPVFHATRPDADPTR